MKTKNFGLKLDPILPEDFLGGTSQSLEAKYGSDVLNPEGDWTPNLPPTENQDTSDGDTWACISFGTSNAVEMLARLLFKESINLSDRFLAKISGTKLGRGNSPKTVADTLRHTWSVNESEWPDVDTVEEYYAEIPGNLESVAIARGAEFEFGYQYISNNPASIKEALKRSPVCIAVTAWMEQGGVYVRIPDLAENHWTTIIKVLDNSNYKVFDSFPPFTKEVSPDACRSVAMSYYLNRQVVVESAWTKFLKLVRALFSQVSESPASAPISTVEAPSTPITTPPTPPTVPPAPESKYDWSNPDTAKHSVRLICDEEGLSLLHNQIVDGKAYMLKDILCACIEQESHFRNLKLDGTPTRNVNYEKDGKTVSSTDWGICQINDYWHIGAGKDFPSVAYLVGNPDAAVRFMTRMFKAGQAKLWSSYVSGAYKQWL